MGTELAFDDLGKGQVPLEFGDVVGAGDLAVTTADAVVLVIPHDPGFRVFGEGRDRTGGDAGGINTVHAEAPDERVTIDLPVFDRAGAVGVKFDDIDGFGGQIHRIVPEAVGIGAVRGQIIVFFAGRHAGLAADTERGVVKNTLGLGEAGYGPPGRNRHRTETGRQDQAPTAGNFEKISSAESHSA